MKTDPIDGFPLSWEQPLWSSSPSFPAAALRPATEYVLTDFRLIIRRRGRIVRELALDDVGRVRLTQNWYQRVAATSSVVVYPVTKGEPLELANIHQGPQLALILQLLSTDRLGAELDRGFVASALAPDAPRLMRPRSGLPIAATLAIAVAFGFLAIARHNTLEPIAYEADDPIAPGGQRRSPEDIASFMEQQVMPFARRVLGPVKGGADKVTCETCHGADAARRQWRMPGVRALPEPEFRSARMERVGLWLEPQIRNAVYGYLAEENKQSTAGYMRAVVMPGMAKLMHRPAYDFTKSYGYNRAHAAFGCYHCHLVQ
jgi:hypothetical protein